MSTVPHYLKSDIPKINFVTKTFVGFDQQEIEKSSNEDLLYIRYVIDSYLKNPNLKKRNIDFKKVFYRIEKELKLRRKNELENKINIKTDNQSLETDESSSEISNSQNLLQSCVFNEFSGIQIPDFLNDKNSKYEIYQSYSKFPQNFPCECKDFNLTTFAENIIKFTNERKKQIINH